MTDAVHARECFIYCQLWALGRAADKSVLSAEAPAGEDWFASASAIAIEGGDVPRELSEEEIWGIVGDYKQAAKNAIDAGFDGVEIHAANGYLIDQFTQDVSNKRTGKSQLKNLPDPFHKYCTYLANTIHSRFLGWIHPRPLPLRHRSN